MKSERKYLTKAPRSSDRAGITVTATHGPGRGFKIIGWEKPNMMTIMEIARIAHEANRGYCEALGDKTQLPWELAPKWQHDSAVDGVVFHIQNPNAGPSGSHENWMKHKLENGWKYSAIKDGREKTHPCLVPFSELPTTQQAKDHIFHAIVKACIGEQI